MPRLRLPMGRRARSGPWHSPARSGPRWELNREAGPVDRRNQTAAVISKMLARSEILRPHT